MLGTNIPIMLYTVPGLTGALFLIPTVEFGSKWGALCFMVTAALSFVLPTEREAFVMFVGLLGYYPILKIIIERLSSRALGTIIKFLVFNIALCGCFWVITTVLGISVFEFSKLGKTVVVIITFAVGNIVFAIYDVALTRVLNAYFIKFRKSFLKILKLK